MWAEPSFVITATAGGCGAVLSGTVSLASPDFNSSDSPLVIAFTFVFAFTLAFLIVNDFPSSLGVNSVLPSIDHLPSSPFLAVIVVSSSDPAGV